MLVERAYAKINLTLDVLKQRPDGFHDVNMVMQTIDLSDLIWLDKTEQEEIEVESAASFIPLDDRNLAVVAAKAFQEYSGIKDGLRIHIDKQIPVAAGLAGGSSDAAAVLRGLNRLYHTNYSLAELAELGASIGSDVPFCVHGGCGVATGRGEQVEHVEHDLKAWVVLVRPNVFVSTADIYKAAPESRFAKAVTSPKMVQALTASDFSRVRQLVNNGLQDTTFSIYREVKMLKDRIESTIHEPVFMSGSGPTLFTLVPNRSAGQRVYNALRGFIKEVYLCRFV